MRTIFAVILAAAALASCAIDELEGAEFDEASSSIFAIRELLCDESRLGMTVYEPSGAPYQLVACGPFPEGGPETCPRLEVLVGGLTMYVDGPFGLGSRIAGAQTDAAVSAATCSPNAIDAGPWLVRIIPAT